MSYAIEVNSSELRNNTKNLRVNGLRSFYTEAQRQGWILVNPTEGVSGAREENIIPKAISEKEIKMILNAPDLNTAAGFRDRCMFELLYSCALRRAECVSFTLDNFAEDLSTVKFMGKGSKEGILPISKMAKHFLKFYIDNIWPRVNKFKSDRLFLSVVTGKPLQIKSLEEIVRKYAKSLGLTGRFCTHGFRYSAATHLADHNADIRLIQEYLRHDKLNSTSRYIRQSLHKLKEVHGYAHPKGA